MLTFTLYSEGRASDHAVHINPHEVASIRETEDRPAFGGWWETAVITMNNGEQFRVQDGARTVAKQIAQAQSQARAEDVG